MIRDRVLELSPVGRLDPDVARNLREWASLTIPDEAIPEFCGDFLPGLAEVFPVVDRAGRLELPEREAMEFELEIRRYAGPDAADGPDLVVQWNRIEVLRMSDGTGSESPDTPDGGGDG